MCPPTQKSHFFNRTYYLAKNKSAVKFLLIFTTNPVISGEHTGSPLPLIELRSYVIYSTTSYIR